MFGQYKREFKYNIYLTNVIIFLFFFSSIRILNHDSINNFYIPMYKRKQEMGIMTNLTIIHPNQ